MRHNQLTVKENESRGNGGDSGQETKDTAKLIGPGSTRNTVSLVCGRQRSQEIGC